MKEKIALFCDVDIEAVVTARDVKSVYQVPVTFAAEGVDENHSPPATQWTLPRAT